MSSFTREEDHDDEDHNDGVPLSTDGGAVSSRVAQYSARFDDDSSDDERAQAEEKAPSVDLSPVVDDDEDEGEFENGYAPLTEVDGADEFGDFQGEESYVTAHLEANLDTVIRMQLSEVDLDHRGGINLLESKESEQRDDVVQAVPAPPAAPQFNPSSIPPLSEDKIGKIKQIMARFTIPPPTPNSAFLADTLQNSRLRVGDELTK